MPKSRPLPPMLAVPSVYKKSMKPFLERLENDRQFRSYFKRVIIEEIQGHCQAWKEESSHYYLDRWTLAHLSKTISENVVKRLINNEEQQV